MHNSKPFTVWFVGALGDGDTSRTQAALVDFAVLVRPTPLGRIWLKNLVYHEKGRPFPQPDFCPSQKVNLFGLVFWVYKK